VTPRLSALAAVWAVLGAGCSYDLDALRGNRDAAVDRGAPVDLGQPVTDTGPRDAGPGEDRPVAERDAIVGTCMLDGGVTTLNLGNAGTLLDDNTNRPETLAVPLASTPVGCTDPDTEGPQRSRVYRVDVRRGGRLTVSTHTGLCNTFDTRIQLVRGCSMAEAQPPLHCADDITTIDPVRCSMCMGIDMPANTTGCFSYLTTAHFDAVQGDTLFAVVHGLRGARGNFRLWAGENAALIEPFNTMATFTVNRCTCLANPGTRREFNFPSMAASPVTLATNMQGLLQGVSIPSGNYQGISAQFRVNVRLSREEPCLVATQRKVVLDLYIGSRVVTAFSIDVRNRSGIVTVPYTPFVSQAITSTMPLGLELRQRSEEPPSGQCLRVEVLPGPENIVALYQAP